MKRGFRVLLIIFTIHIVPAAVRAQQRGAVQVKLIVDPIQHVVLHPVGKTIQTVYNTAGRVNQQIETLHEEQLTVYSTSDFDVRIRATEQHHFRQHGDDKVRFWVLEADALVAHKRWKNGANNTGNPITTYHIWYRSAVFPLSDEPVRSYRYTNLPSRELVYTVTTK